MLAPLTILTFQPPITLNPRMSGDAESQRIGALLYRGLTRIDADLEARPDLALSWEAGGGGRIWVFRLRPGQRDQAGEPITPGRLKTCLENYRAGKPRALILAGMPDWKSTRLEGDRVVFELGRPDPYFPRDVSLLRYFVTPGGPCAEPGPGQAVVASGPLRPHAFPGPWDLAPEEELALDPAPGLEIPGLPRASRPWRFLFIRDDNTRLLKLLHGDADAGLTPISLTKTRWLQRAHPDRFDVLERDGVTVQYLAFNLRDPILVRLDVRRALASAIPRAKIVADKLFGAGTVADSLLSPLLPESHPVAFRPLSLQEAGRLLDQAGFPRGKDGVRFRLRYKTTPQREGFEAGLIFQDAFRRLGVEMELDVVEPAVFFASIRKGAFQLYSSRWIGIGDGSILYRTLRTGQRDNRVGYHDAEADALLDRAMAEPGLAARKPLLARVQALMARDLPYFPLWYWSVDAILKKGLAKPDGGGLRAQDLSLSGALEPLLRLR